MREHTTIPLPHPQLLTEDPFTEIVRQGAGSVLDVAMHRDRAMYHMLSRVQSGGGAASLFAVAGRSACKDASLFEAFSGHCQVNAKNCTSVQLREDYRGFWAFTSPCIFAMPTPSAFLQGKASGSDFSLT
jgi:hypothetical protein